MAFCKHNGGGPKTCPACRREGSNSALIDGLAAEQIKKGISEILHAALSGIDETLRHEKSYIRWGLVEKRIHEKVDELLNVHGG